ncbi:MAG: hypothetical protein AAFX54_08710 [Pseudomonadota bacterium]
MDKEAEVVGGYQALILFACFALFSILSGVLAYFFGGMSAARTAAGGLKLAGEAAEITALVIFLGAVIVPAALMTVFVRRYSYDLAGVSIVASRLIRPKSPPASKSIEDVKYWLRNDPKRVRSETEEYLGKAPEHLLPEKLRSALFDLKKGQSEYPYMIVRGMFEKKYWWLYVMSKYRTLRPYEPGGGDDAHYFVLARALRNAIKMSLAFDALDVELRDEAATGSRWWWDYYSRTDYQHLPMWDDHDMPMRFRTASPHLKWPDLASGSSDGEIPIFRAFSCLENPMGFEIRVLCLRDVIAKMADIAGDLLSDASGADPDSISKRHERVAYYLSVLATTKLKMIGGHNYRDMLPKMGRDTTEKPLLARLDGGPVRLADVEDPNDIINADWAICWDPNRITWADLKPGADGELLQALALMTDAVNEAMRDMARPIRLKRSDVLFLDNRRTLVGRFERNFSKSRSFKNLILGHPGQWWLRRFYGFRVSKTSDSDAGAIGQRETTRFPDSDDLIQHKPDADCDGIATALETDF